jgi:adenylate kinase family enzyme
MKCIEFLSVKKKLIVKQLTKEYKCIKEKLIKYFITSNSLFKHFHYVNIEHVSRIENREANDLAQIASRYRVSKEKLEKLIEIKDKLILTNPFST